MGKSMGRCTCSRLLPVVLILLGTACQPGPHPNEAAEQPEDAAPVEYSGTPEPVRVLPYWVPSAQFAGYYVGIEKGIYRKYGIDLELLDFDPLMSTQDVIRQKRTDFAILWLVNAIDLRSKGVDIVDIAQMSTRSSLMLITKKSSGINNLEDMNGRKAGIWVGYELQPRALFKKYHLNVDIILIGSNNNLFLQDGVDIMNANWFDEYHSIINNGINEDEMNRFFFADYGLNFLEDGLYCLSDLAKENPGLCSRFVKATLESWQYAFDHQEEAIDCVVRYATARNQPVNRPHQKWMLSHYKMLYIPSGSEKINTVMHKASYDSVQNILLESGFIKKAIPFESFYQPYTELPAKPATGEDQ
jgi:NitT/TauT family transport system substrate-binding protein